MTKSEFYEKLNNIWPDDPEDVFMEIEKVTDSYIDELHAQIAKLQSDNSQLVEQMNEMTIKYESLEQHCIALEEDINMWQASGAWKTSVKKEKQ